MLELRRATLALIAALFLAALIFWAWPQHSWKRIVPPPELHTRSDVEARQRNVLSSLLPKLQALTKADREQRSLLSEVERMRVDRLRRRRHASPPQEQATSRSATQLLEKLVVERTAAVLWERSSRITNLTVSALVRSGVEASSRLGEQVVALRCLLYRIRAAPMARQESTREVQAYEEALRRQCATLRVLYVSKDQWWCEGESHTRTSLGCALSEARTLQRVLIYDEEWCERPSHLHASKRHRYSRTRDHVQLPEWALSAAEYVDTCLSAHLRNRSYVLVDSNLPILQLVEQDTIQEAAHLLIRVFGGTRSRTREFGGHRLLPYWYSLCTADTQLAKLPLVPPPLYARAALPVIEHLRELAAHPNQADEPLADSPGYVGVHVRRGDKLARTKVWPHLEQDTDVENIAAALQLLSDSDDAATAQNDAATAQNDAATSQRFPCGSVVYIASNEIVPDFFQRPPLNTCYRVFTVHHFRDRLLRELERVALVGNHTVNAADDELGRNELSERPFTESDVKADVTLYFMDVTILQGAVHTLETFNDLTCDFRSGGRLVPSCRTPLQRLGEHKV